MVNRKPDPAEAAERAAILRLEGVFVTESPLCRLGAQDPRALPPWFGVLSAKPHERILTDDDPRLPSMLRNPSLVDYFTHRFGPSQHLLQSARLARQYGCSEKVVLACLLHDISVFGLLVPDHGYWGAQLIAPYVDEEVASAVRYHQALRHFPDEEAGYEYPQSYIGWFGPDYEVDDKSSATTRWQGSAGGTARLGRSPSMISMRSIRALSSTSASSST